MQHTDNEMLATLHLQNSLLQLNFCQFQMINIVI